MRDERRKRAAISIIPVAGLVLALVAGVTAADEHRSLVDVRSVSRVGRSDAGANF